MTRRTLHPKADIHAQKTKSETIKRWQCGIEQTRALAEKKLKEGDKKGYDKCINIIKNYEEAICREKERIAMGIKQKIF
jgi:hypothetical protein